MSARALTITGLTLWLAATLLRWPSAAEAPDRLSPRVAVATMALGGLSPLLADLLWLRAASQQEAGEYFAMAETTRRIALLQPHSAGLYVFEARNLAFNVAGEFDDPGLRWAWIRRGLQVLVRDGQRAQPREPAIDEAVATILLGRLGDRLDAEAVADRLHWAATWQGVVTADTAGRQRLVARLGPEPWRSWGMDPTLVQEVDGRFGPLDWRTPEAHAIYWTTSAIRKAGSEARRPIAARMRYQALWAAFQGGRMALVPETGRLELLPDSRLIAPLEAEMSRLTELLPDAADLAMARSSMTQDALLVLFLEGREGDALDRLRRTAPDRDPQALQQALDEAVLAAAGWDPTLPAGAAAEVAIGWLATAQRLREVGAADLARGWSRVAQLACDRYPETLPAYSALMERAMREGS